MFCGKCGQVINPKAVICVHCSCPVDSASGTPVAKIPDRPDRLTMAMLPVGRSGYAIAAGYFGLLSVLAVFAPFAIVFGITALYDIGQHPEKAGRGRAIFGMVAGFTFTLVYGFLFAIALINGKL